MAPDWNLGIGLLTRRTTGRSKQKLPTSERCRPIIQQGIIQISEQETRPTFVSETRQKSNYSILQCRRSRTSLQAQLTDPGSSRGIRPEYSLLHSVEAPKPESVSCPRSTLSSYRMLAYELWSKRHCAQHLKGKLFSIFPFLPARNASVSRNCLELRQPSRNPEEKANRKPRN